jgi:hypothetical protein
MQAFFASADLGAGRDAIIGISAGFGIACVIVAGFVWIVSRPYKRKPPETFNSVKDEG